MSAPQVRQIAAQDTLPLRQSVLWPDLPLAALAVDGDADALHLGAFDGGLIGVGSFYRDGTGARLRKLAVAADRQGQGIGARLVRAGARHLAAQGARLLWCDARVTAGAFYTRLGFTLSGVPFDKSGVTYRRATLPLDGTPADP
ncbi:GNAT family N-acetyltransferase [Jannaschia sp. M317]|uniref:GNAT family N-acetyltransferase n=1 Tax=Jannaschia sp. M317 TaxID=2867011 RepID=UPI0021A2DE81|nr:GNAT family N-acetyltransferase [Jannaschia sp. M317]UWQ17407.1 GNAT family N-acetyltransferase [Jannaschia sp. M317]